MTTIAEAVSYGVVTNPVIVGIGALILTSFVFLIFKDFLSKVFAIVIGVIFLQLLVTGEFDRLMAIIIFFISLCLFSVRFVLWFLGGWDGQGVSHVGFIESAKTYDVGGIISSVGVAFAAAWAMTFETAESLITNTYFNWKK